MVATCGPTERAFWPPLLHRSRRAELLAVGKPPLLAAETSEMAVVGRSMTSVGGLSDCSAVSVGVLCLCRSPRYVHLAYCGSNPFSVYSSPSIYVGLVDILHHYYALTCEIQ